MKRRQRRRRRRQEEEDQNLKVLYFLAGIVITYVDVSLTPCNGPLVN